MTFVFNGDADGLCALQQICLAHGFSSPRLITGPKRRIDLVREVAADVEEVTVLDVSLAVNRKDVLRLLHAGVRVRYFDHHDPGAPLAHPRLHAFIDVSPGVCTSVIVNRHLGARHPRWAIAGAFGDNLDETARSLAARHGLSSEETAVLRALGIALNYNAYGESEADLYFPPAELFGRLSAYADPLAFAREDAAFRELSEGYRQDLVRAEGLAPYAAAPHAALYLLPDAAWARRVSGVLASGLARRAPQRAHAVALACAGGGWQVSVRAPLVHPYGAVALCRSYESGGGREGAGGINRLPAEELERFAARFIAHFRPAAAA